MFCSSTSFFCHCCLSLLCFSDNSDWSSMHSFLKRICNETSVYWECIVRSPWFHLWESSKHSPHFLSSSPRCPFLDLQVLLLTSCFPFPVSRFPFPVSRSRCPVSSFSFPVSRIPFSHFPFPVPNSHILNVFSSMFFSWSLNFPLQGSRFFSQCFSIKFFMIKHVTLRKKHNTTVPHQYWITFSLAVNRSKITINYTKAYFPKVLSLFFFLIPLLHCGITKVVQCPS